ncbi:Potassium channel protein [hydrothermal vent metagenome]|uniref:Potassium channel protein n=1 Tax=hydrothermal vent metagenome TaxID=652676 RepID=A0A3B0R3M0_9ZZZZ
MDWEGRILKTVGLVLLIAAAGVAGLMVIEGWSFVDALYMTVITISTVGFGEVHPLSEGGKLLVIILIIFGVGAYIYIISIVAEYLVAGALIGGIGRRKMKKQIEELDRHCIVCGYGRVGSEVAIELKNGGVEVVVIEKDPERLKLCAARGYLYVEGDASSDEVLVEAGVHRARGLVSAVDSDAANVYVTLSTKSLNKDIFVVARSERADSEKKLRAAGADRVISPSGIGGRRLASQLLKPAVLEFLDVVMHSADIEIFMEEVKVKQSSVFVGMTLVEAKKKCLEDANILAVLKVDGGNMDVELSADTRIEGGDMLIVIGTRAQLRSLEGLA